MRIYRGTHRRVSSLVWNQRNRKMRRVTFDARIDGGSGWNGLFVCFVFLLSTFACRPFLWVKRFFFFFAFGAAEWQSHSCKWRPARIDSFFFSDFNQSIQWWRWLVLIFRCKLTLATFIAASAPIQTHPSTADLRWFAGFCVASGKPNRKLNWTRKDRSEK